MRPTGIDHDQIRRHQRNSSEKRHENRRFHPTKIQHDQKQGHKTGTHRQRRKTRRQGRQRQAESDGSKAEIENRAKRQAGGEEECRISRGGEEAPPQGRESRVHRLGRLGQRFGAAGDRALRRGLADEQLVRSGEAGFEGERFECFLRPAGDDGRFSVAGRGEEELQVREERGVGFRAAGE